MSRRTVLWVVGGVAAAALLALLWWTSARRDARDGDRVRRAGGTEELEVGEPAVFTLYFPGPGGLLHPEERELAVVETVRGQARTLVLALLGGPETAGFVAPFPQDVGLLDLYLGPDGVAFVDLGRGGAEGGADGGEDGGGEEPAAGGAAEDPASGPPAGGSREEMQRVYSVVQTLTGNLPDISRVALLWNGRQLPSLSGHLDTSLPLGPKASLLARRTPGTGAAAGSSTGDGGDGP